MKLGRVGLWPWQKVPLDAFGFLTTRGPSLFSKPNPKMAVLRVIRGQNVMKLGRIDPWPYQRVPGDPFGFMATSGPNLFRNWNPKTWNLAWQYWSLAKAASLLWCIWIYWPPGVPSLCSKWNPQMVFWQVWGLNREFQLGPSLACQPKAPTSECLLPS